MYLLVGTGAVGMMGGGACAVLVAYAPNYPSYPTGL